MREQDLEVLREWWREEALSIAVAAQVPLSVSSTMDDDHDDDDDAGTVRRRSWVSSLTKAVSSATKAVSDTVSTVTDAGEDAVEDAVGDSTEALSLDGAYRDPAGRGASRDHDDEGTTEGPARPLEGTPI